MGAKGLKYGSEKIKPSRLRAVCVVVIFIVVAGALYVAGKALDAKDQKPETRGVYVQTASGNTLEVDGVKYIEKERLTTILLMGVDRPTSSESQTGYRNGGQADFLRLVVIDNDAKQISQLQIDRDTMTPITVLGVLGNRSRSRTAQISLSHGFGDGHEQSCELTVEAVSNLLSDAPIDFYLALNFDGIATFNDAVGGVMVTLEDDFSQMDPQMVSGTTIILNGRQAEMFVRGRMSVGDGTNVSRMKRQEQYISSLSAKLDEKIHENQDYIGTLYDQLKTFLTTNMSRAKLINEMWKSRDYEHIAVKMLPGEHRVGSDGFMEFHVDEEELQQVVLEMFFDRVG